MSHISDYCHMKARQFTSTFLGQRSYTSIFSPHSGKDEAFSSVDSKQYNSSAQNLDLCHGLSLD